MLHLTHIPRPGVAFQRPQTRPGQLRLLIVPLVRPPDEKLRQQWNITAPFPQRRHFNPDHIQPVPKILTELAVVHQLLQIPIRRRHHPHIHGLRLRRAHRLDLSLLQESQQLQLRVQLNLADFVQENRPAMRRLKVADAIPIRTSVGAPKRAKQLALDQCRRNRAAIHRHKRLIGSRAVAMYHACDQFLARPRLAFNQYRRVFRRGQRDRLVDRDHSRRTADHLRLGQILGFNLVLVLDAERSLSPLHRVQKPVELKWFRQVIESAALGGAHHRLHGAPARHQNDGASGIGFARCPQYIQPGAFVQIDIGKNNRVRFFLQPFQRLTGRRNSVHGIAFQLQKHNYRGPYRVIIFHYQQTRQ